MNKNGFTLIELLAVIVILAVILVITMPKIINIVEESEKESFKITAETIVRKAEEISLSNNNTESVDTTYTIVDGSFVGNSMPISGSLPDSATIVAKTGGNVSLVARTDKYCVIKGFEDIGLTLVSEEDCSLPVSLDSKIYGVTFNNATVGTRTDDAVGLTYTVNASTITSSFDTADIYKDITEETDSYGNVFVKIPSFYIKKTKNTGNIWTYQISKEQQDTDYYLPECFKNSTTGELLDYVLIGKYHASLNGTKLESKSGVAALSYPTSVSTFRTYARNNGTGYQLIDIHAIDVLQTLFYIEFATLDSQSIMYGNSKKYYPPLLVSGGSDTVTTPSGSPTSNTAGKQSFKYREVENIWGNIWQMVDGINIRNGQVYVAKNPANYSSTLFTGEYVPIGYTNANVANYTSEVGYDSNYPYANFPIAVTTYDNSIYKDYFNPRVTGDRIALFGGHHYDGDECGLSNWNLFDYSNGYSTDMPTASTRLMKKIG